MRNSLPMHVTITARGIDNVQMIDASQIVSAKYAAMKPSAQRIIAPRKNMTSPNGRAGGGSERSSGMRIVLAPTSVCAGRLA